MCLLKRATDVVLFGILAIAGLCANAEQDQPEQGVEIRVVPDSTESITLDHGASINPKLFSIVDDSAKGLREEERDLYFRGLKLSHETPLSVMRDAAEQLQEQRRKADPKYAQSPPARFPQFVDLFRNPEVYRGRAVSLRGTIRRLTKYDPGKNSYGIAEVYEGWLYSADSNSNPVVVIFTSKPAELNLGNDITDEIRATGYFFKLYNYDSQGGPGKAPMLLAGTVEWNPGPRSFVFPPLSRSFYVFITLALLVLGFGIWKANSPGHVERLLPQEPVDLTKLPPVDDHS